MIGRGRRKPMRRKKPKKSRRRHCLQHPKRKIGLPTFLRVLEETHSFRKAITQTFIALLSEKKDTHIAKRFGNEIASEVKSRASEVLKNGGIFTEEGRKLLDELDHYLRFSNVRNINPGSTADLAATTTFFALLMGYRP